MNKLDQRIQLVASKHFSEVVDAWRRRQRDLPSRSEAIRRLVQRGLEAEEAFPLRLVTAIVHPERAASVREALAEIGACDLTVTEATGVGRPLDRSEWRRDDAGAAVERPKLRIDVAVPAELAEEAVAAIAAAARAGALGDALILVTPLSTALRLQPGDGGAEPRG